MSCVSDFLILDMSSMPMLSMLLFGYTWVSFGLEVVGWLLLAIFRAASAAYTVVNWMLLG